MAETSIPFEDPARPFFAGLIETVGLAFTDPKRLFSNMPGDDIGRPVLYFVIIGTIAAVISLAWQTLFGGLASVAEGVDLGEFAIGTGMVLVMMLFSPAFVLLSLFISTAIYHVMLLLLGDGQRGFATTLRAVSYGSTPHILAVIPVCGWLFAGVWAVVLTIMAATYGHGTPAWRAVLAYFLPAIICCCAISLVAGGLALLTGLGGF